MPPGRDLAARIFDFVYNTILFLDAAIRLLGQVVFLLTIPLAVFCPLWVFGIAVPLITYFIADPELRRLLVALTILTSLDSRSVLVQDVRDWERAELALERRA
jgi:hypothetical protein